MCLFMYLHKDNSCLSVTPLSSPFGNPLPPWYLGNVFKEEKRGLGGMFLRPLGSQPVYTSVCLSQSSGYSG